MRDESSLPTALSVSSRTGIATRIGAVADYHPHFTTIILMPCTIHITRALAVCHSGSALTASKVRPPDRPAIALQDTKHRAGSHTNSVSSASKIDTQCLKVHPTTARNACKSRIESPYHLHHAFTDLSLCLFPATWMTVAR